jgi:alpha-glucuronidase
LNDRGLEEIDKMEDLQHLSDYKCWLQYNRITNEKWLERHRELLSNLVVPTQSNIIQSAKKEYISAITKMLGMEPKVSYVVTDKPFIAFETFENGILTGSNIPNEAFESLNDEGYLILTENDHLYVIGKTEKGLLYAVFHLLRFIQLEKDLYTLNVMESPKNALRLINHWDNMDGSVERGYAGRSIFFDYNRFTTNFERIKDYARLLASVGINGTSINNVNVHFEETKLITEEYLPDVARVAEVFRSYGIKTYLSVNYASSIQLGRLDTADPLNEDVKDWWKQKAIEIYHYIPDFGGFVVKADSEHRPGPFTYSRNHADGANMLAEALKPFGGVVFWRCFVYNCMQDWRNRETDRARAAYDHFKPLDGLFLDNVILQIKNGPIDFQVREPVSPLFGAMPRTNQVLEFQVTQEYTGQQKHLCYLVPQWKEILDFDTYAKGKGSTVKKVVDGSLYDYAYSGITAVSNIGNDLNWSGHTLAQANFYGYGRLIWNPDLRTEEITEEWIVQTFGKDEFMVEQISSMLLESWRIYEKYTAPLGVGWMVNPGHHYGPNVDGYEYSVWGTYHFADWQGIGVNRTVKDGTGYTSQYFKENAQIYEALETCPEELLLFFHHVPYSHKLHSGETVIQHIYNTHFEGAEEADVLKQQWVALDGRIDSYRYEGVLKRLIEQAEHSKEWRDIINTYFYRKSGIQDEKQRKIY